MRLARPLCALPLLGLFLTATAAHAVVGPPTNILYGFVTGNTVLTAAYPGPTYYVVGDLVVTPGSTLSIQPGVSLEFSANRDTLVGGSYPGLCELTVQGTLIADASAGSSIRLESTNQTAGTWGGIATASTGTVTLKNVELLHAVWGLALSPGLPNTIDGLFMSQVVSGISANSALLRVRNCNLIGQSNNNGTGFLAGPGVDFSQPDSLAPQPTTIAQFAQGLSASPGTYLTNLIVRDNYFGIQLSGDNCFVNYCTIVRNQTGVSGSGTIFNSIVALNGRGISGYGAGLVDYLDAWSNSQPIQGFSIGPHVASFSPFFKNASTNDFRLEDGSIFKFWSNSGGEIGAYGPGPGLPTATRRTSTWGGLKTRFR